MITNTSTHTAYGLYLDASTGYSVTGNDFVQNSTGSALNTKGIIVSNSGEAVNLIYNNSFHKLKVGIQVIGINGIDYNDACCYQVNQGLNLKCNYFYDNLVQADIALTSAPITRIALLQGTCLNLPTSPAGNRFSHSINNTENDIFTDAGSVIFNYLSHDAPTSVTPFTYDPLKVGVGVCTGPDFVLSTACPTVPVLEGLPGLAAAVSNAEAGVNTSLAVAEQSGALEEGVLLDETDQANLIIVDSKKTDLAIALNKLESAYLTDNTQTDKLGKVIETLLPQTDIESQRRLAMAYWKKGNTTELATVKTNLQTAGQTQFVNYLDILTTVGNNNTNLPALATNAALMAQINAAITQTEDVKVAGYASALLCAISGICPVPVIPELVFNSGLRTMQTSDATTIDLAVYPNPVQDVLEIQIDNTGKLNCKIVDLSGKLIKEINLNETERNFSTSFLSAGIYFLEIKTEGNVKQLVRLVKE
jgi:Secretion system C-terminal sorting domain